MKIYFSWSTTSTTIIFIVTLKNDAGRKKLKMNTTDDGDFYKRLQAKCEIAKCEIVLLQELQFFCSTI